MAENIVREGYINGSIIPVSLEGTNKILNQMKFNVCRIYKAGINGTGFFCNLPYKSKLIPFLITNNHIINSEDIDNKKDIKISINNGKEFKNIRIDETRIVLTNKDLDFTLIEIKQKKDNIDITKCFEIDKNYNIEEEYLKEIYAKKSVYVIHYPQDDNVVVSFGLISQINEKEINHLCSTENGSSGAPILSLKTFNVIGVHYGFKNQRNYNLGTFIKSIIKELNNYNQISVNNQNIINEDINDLQNKSLNQNLDQEIIIIKKEYMNLIY